MVILRIVYNCFITTLNGQKGSIFLTSRRGVTYGEPMTSENFSNYADGEVESQPQIWQQVADFAPSVLELLPKPGERVAVTGCGSSWFMSMCYAALRESSGQGETDVWVTSEFNYQRKYDRIVAISRSGTTTEVIDALSKINVPSVIITAIENSPISAHTDHEIVMPFADEKSVIQTRWATAALGLLRMSLGLDLKAIVKDAETALSEDISHLTDLEQITFIGRGWTYGLAQEAALKTRESAQYWAEAYPALDYRHGPLSISQPGRGVWAFGEIPDSLVNDIKETGATFESSKLDPMAHLIKAQRVAIAIAKKRGLNFDNPRGLARSIILK
jgi:fructoselysine-6-P-deglycase FrlB-like protein